MEIIIPSIITFLLPYLTKASDVIFEEETRNTWDKIKGFIKGEDKADEVVAKIEEGSDDKETLGAFKAIFEIKAQENEQFRQVLIELSSTYKDVIAEALQKSTYRFDSVSGDFVSGHKFYTRTVTINNHYYNTPDEEYQLSRTTADLSGLDSNPELKRSLESKLFNIKILINEKRYNDAIKLCKEVRDTHSVLPELWEYSAIGTYLVSADKSEIIDSSARTIITFLNAAKELRKSDNHPAHTAIANEISSRYFKTITNRLNKSLANNKNTYKEQLTIFKLINEFKTCYLIFPDTLYIKTFAEYLSGNKDFTWLYMEEQGTPPKKYFQLTANILLSDYSPTNQSIHRILEKLGTSFPECAKMLATVPIKFFSSRHATLFTESEYTNFIKKKKYDLDLEFSQLQTNIQLQRQSVEHLTDKYNHEKSQWFNGSATDAAYARLTAAKKGLANLISQSDNNRKLIEFYAS